MPHRVQLTTYNYVKGTEIGIFDFEVIEVKLCMNQVVRRSREVSHHGAYCRIRALQFRKGGCHALYDGVVDIGHRFSERLGQFNYVSPSSFN